MDNMANRREYYSADEKEAIGRELDELEPFKHRANYCAYFGLGLAAVGALFSDPGVAVVGGSLAIFSELAAQRRAQIEYYNKMHHLRMDEIREARNSKLFDKVQRG